MDEEAAEIGSDQSRSDPIVVHATEGTVTRPCAAWPCRPSRLDPHRTARRPPATVPRRPRDEILGGAGRGQISPAAQHDGEIVVSAGIQDEIVNDDRCRATRIGVIITCSPDVTSKPGLRQGGEIRAGSRWGTRRIAVPGSPVSGVNSVHVGVKPVACVFFPQPHGQAGDQIFSARRAVIVAAEGDGDIDHGMSIGIQRNEIDQGSAGSVGPTVDARLDGAGRCAAEADLIEMRF